MTDTFSTQNSALDSPATHAWSITASATPFTYATRSIYVGGAGDVTVTMISGASVTFTAPAGAILPVRCTHVTAATATALIGLV